MRKPAPSTGLLQLEELCSLARIRPSTEAIGHGLQAERTPPPADACGTVFSLCAIMESFYAESTPDRLVRLPHLTKGKIMKEGIHPNYREVLFVDMSNGFKFVTRSCVSTKETENFEGKEYPLFKLDTTSESHPFYTGTQKSVDNMGGRVEKFRNRFGKK